MKDVRITRKGLLQLGATPDKKAAALLKLRLAKLEKKKTEDGKREERQKERNVNFRQLIDIRKRVATKGRAIA
jgi:hypothetical protein